MKLSLEIQTFVTLSLGLSMLFLYAESFLKILIVPHFIYLLLLLLLLSFRNDGGIVFQIFPYCGSALSSIHNAFNIPLFLVTL